MATDMCTVRQGSRSKNLGRNPARDQTSRPLHFIWILDCSSSMGEDGKLQSLNQAIREFLPALNAAVSGLEDLFRAVKFGHLADWHIVREASLKEFHLDGPR